MRCPDCNKFVGMENGDPELNLECEFRDDAFNITGDVRHTRNCADCSTELKSIDHSPDETIDFDTLVATAGLDDAQKARLLKALQDDASEVFEFSEGVGEANEAGGGRYAKNMISIMVPYTISINLEEEGQEPIKFEYNSEIELKAAAGEYEECC